MATSRASDRCSPQPQCDFVLVNRNGGQHGKLGEIVSKLGFDAIGKYIPPTRYGQIFETDSLNQLTCEEQRMHRRGLVVQLLAQHCQLKLWKGQACLHPKRL